MFSGINGDFVYHLSLIVYLSLIVKMCFLLRFLSLVPYICALLKTNDKPMKNQGTT